MAKKKANGNTGGKRHATQASLNSAVKSICDVMRRSNCAGAMTYVPELTWILFLRILDERETHEAEESEALGLKFQPSLKAPYRWQDWAAPESPRRKDTSAEASVWKFLHDELLPKLRGLKNERGATVRQKVISEIMSSVERSRIDSEKNFLDVIDKVHELSQEAVDDTHVFPLSQVYEGLLLKMGEKANDGGQFFTPREIIRTMIRVVDPQIGQTVYDPGCGTGGFLAQAFEYMKSQAGNSITSVQLETLRRRTFHGREKDNTIYPIALANLVLHGIDEPHIWHGNALSGMAAGGDLFRSAPQFHDCVLMNPPFGGKEGKEAQTQFDYKTGATQVLFLQHVLKTLKQGGTCGIVLDEGVLFKTNETAFVQTKRKLLEECDVWCIVSLPGGVFSSAGAGVKTNLMFFTKGEQTENIWYYDLSDLKIGKRTPITRQHFAEFLELLPDRKKSERSWSVPFADNLQTALEEARPFRETCIQLSMQAVELENTFKAKKKTGKATKKVLEKLEQDWKAKLKESRDASAKAESIENAVYDLKAVNPDRVNTDDQRTPWQLLTVIAEKGRDADAALERLQSLVAKALD